MSYRPQPRQPPKRLPRRLLIKTVPSGIREQGIVGNWLCYYLRGGDHLHDFSPEDNHGTLTSTDTDRPTWVDGRYGWGLLFDGADDYVEVADDPSLDGLSAITISGWVKIPSGTLTSSKDIVRKQGNTTDDGSYALGGGWTDHKAGSWLSDSGGNWHYAGDSSSDIDDGEWHFVSVTYDGSTIRLYVDGVQENSNNIGSITINDSTGKLSIGADAPEQDREYLNGRIAIVRIYNVAKSSSWISRRFARTKGIFGK